MAKIEKIGNIQIVDNKEDKFFYFPMISMACTGSGYQAVEKSNLPHGFLFFTAPQLIGLLVDKLKRFVVGIGSIFA